MSKLMTPCISSIMLGHFSIASLLQLLWIGCVEAKACGVIDLIAR